MSETRTARVGELVRIVGGGTPSRNNPDYYGGDIPWVTPKDMKSWSIDRAQVGITQAGLDGSSTRLVESNSILVVVRSGVLKHTLPVGLNRRPVAINQDIKALIPLGSISPDYLARFIKASSSLILSWVRATTADNFPIDKLRELEVPLLDPAAQKRIVDVLDSVDVLRAERREALRRLDELATSIFLEMFGDLQANPKGWSVECLRDLVSEFRYGTSNKSGPEGKPALRIPNVVGGALDLTELKLVPVSPSDFNRLRLKDGDLLFVRTNGNPEYVGRCAVFEESSVASTRFPADEYVYASYLIRARLRSGKVLPVFVQEYLRTSAGRSALRERCKTSAGQYNLNVEGLGSIPIPTPPIEMQRAFVERIAAVGGLKVTHHAGLAELDALFASLQDKAFRGSL
ncbi:restriction endonuclease subunit S [Micromonospora chokoriensis]|uniref:Type I restriction enzyme, S subunit n=1 Tax=Micromonospora chokoriensis TaxID=356851 RepID=A0A1C4WNH6_9ACTN|nr:restriction endonuclease subunit S [Micromonospora chokoriensis]SCE97719.1 type I restriction enzyme, S subunit [Micromonospora chokoriensis]